MIAYTRALVLNDKKGIYYKVQSFTEVRLVPIAEVNLGYLNVCYRESCRSDCVYQRQQSADAVEKL